MHPIYTPPAPRVSEDAPVKSVEEKEGDGKNEEHKETENNPLVDFKRIPFPDAVEQQFEESLRAIHQRPTRIHSLEQAEAQVQMIVKKYTQRVNQILVSHGLQKAPRRNLSSSSASSSSSSRGMDTISEEGTTCSVNFKFEPYTAVGDYGSIGTNRSTLKMAVEN